LGSTAINEYAIATLAALVVVWVIVAYFRGLRYRLSVRASSWLAAQCVRDFGRRHCPGNSDLEAFCLFLEEAARARDLPAWDSKERELILPDLRELLPEELSGIDGLWELVESAREISASQMYCAYNPAEVAELLRRVIDISGFNVNSGVNMVALRGHSPCRDGWGEPVQEEVIAEWASVGKLNQP